MLAGRFKYSPAFIFRATLLKGSGLRLSYNLKPACHPKWGVSPKTLLGVKLLDLLAHVIDFLFHEAWEDGE